MRVLRSVLGFVALGSCAAACGLELIGSAGPPADASAADATVPGDDASSRSDAADASAGDDAESRGDAAPDAARDSAPTDARADAPYDADAAPAIVYVCPTGNTTDCSTCSGRPLGCVMCGPTDNYAVCVPLGSSCFGSYKPAGYDWCRCSYPDASTCVLPDQGCNTYAGGVCVTCGENLTQGNPCKRGGTCDQASHACR